MKKNTISVLICITAMFIASPFMAAASQALQTGKKDYVNIQRLAGRGVRTDGGYVLELRDVNYPGSTYTLQYDASYDRLEGTYFQAVHRQTFDIEFVRTR